MRAFYPDGYHLLLRDLDRATPIDDVIAWIDDPERRCPPTPKRPRAALARRSNDALPLPRHFAVGWIVAGPVAQLDRASPSEGEGRTFESCRVRQSFQRLIEQPI